MLEAPVRASAQAGAIKAPKPKQVISQLTRATSRSLGLTGSQRIFFSIGVIFAILIGIVLWKRWRSKSSATRVKPEASVSVAAEQPMLAAGELLGVWRRFVRGLPAIFRRSIFNFQPFIVLGPATAGKTAAISRYTDWERQARQALPSETRNEHLQIYLSSRSVAVELSPSLLWDATPRARRALLKLFQCIGRQQMPIVAVVLDVAALNRMSPDAVRALADALRAKINLLAQARPRRERRPLEVRIVLTHLDSAPGYGAFGEFAHSQDIALRFPLSMEAGPSAVSEQLTAGMGSFGRYLSLALTRLSAERYQSVVQFLRQAPELVEGNLPAALSALFADDALSQRPRCGAVYLACAQDVGPGSNPFHLPASASTPERGTLLGRSEMVAYGLCAAICAWLIAGFFVERGLWQRAAEAAPKGAATLGADGLMPVRTFLMRSDGLSRLLPSFYDEADPAFAAFLARAVRDARLLPGYRRAVAAAEWPLHEALCHLAVIHGGSSVRLGAVARELVRVGPDRWPERSLVDDYLRVSSRVDTPLQPLDWLLQVREPETAAWLKFDNRLRAATADPSLPEVELVDIQEHARSIQRGIQRARTCGDTELGVVREELGQIYGSAFKPLEQQLARHDALLMPLLRDVENVTTTPGPSQRPKTLPSLADALTRLLALDAAASQPLRATVEVGAVDAHSPSAEAQRADPDSAEPTDAMAASRAVPAAVENATKMTGPPLGAPSGAWDRLVRRSRAVELMEVCLEVLDTSDTRLFGQDGSQSGPRFRSTAGEIVEGRGLFSRPSSIKPAYTRTTFETEVKPALREVAEALVQLEGRDWVAPAQLQGCRDGIRHRVGEYADAYRTSLDAFFDAFTIKATSRDDVDVLFRYLAQPVSPLTAFLETVHVNADLDFTTDNEQLADLLEPLRVALVPYGGLNRLMASGEGKPRPLDVYLLRMDQIRSRFSQAGVDDGQTPMEAISLHERLSGSGQLALESLTSPGDNISTWLQGFLEEAQLWGAHARPFREPITALLTVGNEEIQQQLAEVWHHDVLPQLAPIMRKFPFTPEAEAEITAAELEQAFHPVEGMMMDRYHRFFEPVTRFAAGKYSAYKGGPPLPGNMLEILNRVAALTHALWDDKGAPRQLAVRVRPIPFGATRDRKAVLTLAYVRFGDESLFNFNQRPASKDLSVSWTAPQMSQVGVQLTDARNGQQRYPRSLGTSASYFSPLRLIQQGTKPPAGLVFREADGLMLAERQWALPLAADAELGAGEAGSARDGEAAVLARFLVDETLLGLFNFGELTRADEVRFAAATRGGQ